MSNDSLFGLMTLSTFVRVPSEEGGRNKRIRLHSVYCNRQDCAEYVESFKMQNPALAKHHIDAEFVIREIV